MEIELHLLISIARFSGKPNVFVEYKEKEIENERIIFTCKIEID